MNDIKVFYHFYDYRELENTSYEELVKVIKDYEEEVQCQNQWKK